MISRIQLSRVTHPGLGYDFKVFFESGRLVSKGLSPYLQPECLNGPLHAFFWSLIVKFDSELVLGALRLVSLILIPVVFLQISQILGLHLHSREIFSLSALIQISSFNLNLIAYGQVTLISASLLLVAFRVVSRVNANNSRSTLYSLLFSSISIFLLDNKPHLLFTLAYLFYIKIRVLWIYSLSFGTAYVWFTSHDDFTYIREWIFSVTNRSRGQLALGDKTTIFALPLFLKITVVIIVVTIIGRLLLVSGKKLKLRNLYTPNSVFCFTIFFPIVFGPYVHPQDGILLAMFVLAILFARTKIFFRVLPPLLMGMFLIWSSTSIGVLILSIVIVIVIYFISSTLSIRISSSHLTLCLVPSILFYGLSLSMEIGQIRSAFYFVGLLGLTVLLVLHMIDQKTCEQIN